MTLINKFYKDCCCYEKLCPWTWYPTPLFKTQHPLQTQPQMKWGNKNVKPLTDYFQAFLSHTLQGVFKRNISNPISSWPQILDDNGCGMKSSLYMKKRIIKEVYIIAITVRDARSASLAFFINAFTSLLDLSMWHAFLYVKIFSGMKVCQRTIMCTFYFLWMTTFF